MLRTQLSRVVPREARSASSNNGSRLEFFDYTAYAHAVKTAVKWKIEFQVQNYRCFGDKPAVLTLRKGVTAFIGANNSGKSTILRFFFEFRPLFTQIGADQNWFLQANQGEGAVARPGTIHDLNQLFHKGE